MDATGQGDGYVSLYRLSRRSGISSARLRKAVARHLVPTVFLPVSTDRYRVLSIRAADAPRVIDLAQHLPTRRRHRREPEGLPCPTCGRPTQRA